MVLNYFLNESAFLILQIFSVVILEGSIALIFLLSILALIAFAIFKEINSKSKKHLNTDTTDEDISDSTSDTEPVTGYEGIQKELEAVGFSYDKNQDIFYSCMDAWQRNFGYCKLYDDSSAALCMLIHCEPIKFEYEGKDWLIEIWKGQYGLTTGGEVGVYISDKPIIDIPDFFNGKFYESADDNNLLQMSYAFKKNGNILFTRNEKHWWLTGFILGEYSEPDEVSMDVVITLKDTTMTNAFVNALKKAGYRDSELFVEGTTVSFFFNKPHTEQPESQTSLIATINQERNKSLCEKYREVINTIKVEKINWKEYPELHNQILKMGKQQQFFKAYNKIFKSKS